MSEIEELKRRIQALEAEVAMLRSHTPVPWPLLPIQNEQPRTFPVPDFRPGEVVCWTKRWDCAR